MDLRDDNIVGKGFYSTVYRYSSKLVIKVPDKLPRKMLENELVKTHFATTAGIPCARVFRIIDVGDGKCGLIMEYLKGENFRSLLRKDPGNTDTYIRQFVEFFRKIHSVPFRNYAVDNIREDLMEEIRVKHANGLIGLQDCEIMLEIVGAVPDADTFVHADFSDKNMICTEDGFKLIDLNTAGYGSELFDLTGMYKAFYRATFTKNRNLSPCAFFCSLKYRILWNRFLKLYYENADKETLKMTGNRIGLLSALRTYVSLLDDAPTGKEIRYRKRELDHWLRKYRKHKDLFIKVMNSV